MREPFRTLPAYTGNNFIRIEGISLIRNHAFCSAILDDNILNHSHKLNFNTGGKQMILKPRINLIALFRAEMTNRTFNQFQICPNRFSADTLNRSIIFQPVNPFIRSKFQINFIRFI